MSPDDPSEEDIDDNLRSSVYDYSKEHVELVVEDIFKHWKERSNNRKYNALFTVHVGGNKASTPRAMEYFDKFAEINQTKAPEDRLKVAISFSADTSNGIHQLKTNENLHRAIIAYNQMFGTSFYMTSVKQYTEDLARRLNKTADDRKYLDLVIVVDQLLTGFDAPEMNTLYIDRTLKGGNLIQAYSRTNRMHDLVDKPWGNVVNYRWPKQNEYAMNEAFAIYSNRSSAAEQQSLEELKAENEQSNIISRPFSEVQAQIRGVVSELSELTDEFVQVPPSEKDQDETFEKLKEYNRLLSQLKQYTTDDKGNTVSAYDDPEEFYDRIGITEEQEVLLTTVIAGELKARCAERDDIDVSQIDLEMVHIHDVTINYDYLIDLIAKMADEIHANKIEEAKETKEAIKQEIAKSDNDKEKAKVTDFVEKIF